ncbi:hypothetical protein AB0G05_27470, partial [Nonomuraea wenchangensis]
MTMGFVVIGHGLGVLWGARPVDGGAGRRRALVVLGLLLALVAVVEVLAGQPIAGGWSVSVPAGGPASSQSLLAGGPASPPEDVAGGTAWSRGPGGPLRLLVLPLLALATTLPLPLLAAQPMIAAGVGGVAAVLSVGAFHTLTVAGAVAQVIALYRAGRRGRPGPALALAAPFPALALLPVAGLSVAEVPVAGFPAAGLPVGELVLALACLAPVAALGGIARAARAAAGAHTAA